MVYVGLDDEGSEYSDSCEWDAWWWLQFLFETEDGRRVQWPIEEMR